MGKWVTRETAPDTGLSRARRFPPFERLVYSFPSCAMSQPPFTNRSTIVICLLLAGLVTLAFGQGARFDFTSFDDPEWVSDNPAVQGGLNSAGIRYAFGSTVLGHWAPLTMLSHMAVCQ